MPEQCTSQTALSAQVRDEPVAVDPAGPYIVGPPQKSGVTLFTWRVLEDFSGRHAPQVTRRRQGWPVALVAPELHVCPLDLPTGPSSVEGKVKPDERKPDADRLGRRPGVLSGVSVNGLLVQEVPAGALCVVCRQFEVGAVARWRSRERGLDLDGAHG
jgi:hypothetical protein